MHAKRDFSVAGLFTNFEIPLSSALARVSGDSSAESAIIGMLLFIIHF